MKYGKYSSRSGKKFKSKEKVEKQDKNLRRKQKWKNYVRKSENKKHMFEKNNIFLDVRK